MNEAELISLLNLLVKAPSLVRNISESKLDTEFGLIEIECMGSCVNITLHNGIVISITLAEKKDEITLLFEEIRISCTEFGLYLLKDRINKCYEAISGNSDNNGSV